MAELLIKVVDATNLISEKDARGCYKAGDIVDIRDNGWPWGTEERNTAKFRIITLTNRTAQQLRDAAMTRWGWELTSPEFSGSVDLEGRPIRVLRRRIRFNLTGAPASGTFAGLRSRIIDKVLGTAL